jgi:DNA replication and repair protein RecF
MHLASLQALNFKNYSEVNISFSPNVNLFTGSNGSGKTNLLDAIYFLSLTKSAFHSIDANNIKHEEKFLSLRGDYCKNDKNISIGAGLERGSKKIFRLNKKPYEKITDHIGSFPAVLITPYDTDLIREGSEERRKFFDSMLSQTDPVYLGELLQYNKALRQRNSLLKQLAEKRNPDRDLLAGYDKILLKTGAYIFQKRKELLDTFIPLFAEHYQNLSESREEVTLQYQSHQLTQNFGEIFRKNLEKDLILQRTGKGIHKDDFIFEIDSFPLKSYGSQGQQKSYVIALKLAQFQYIYEKCRIKPLLLLDDILDKLDQSRINQLMEIISGPLFGQVFITEARSDRVENFFHQIRGEIRKFKIANGEIMVESSDHRT